MPCCTITNRDSVPDCKITDVNSEWSSLPVVYMAWTECEGGTLDSCFTSESRWKVCKELIVVTMSTVGELDGLEYDHYGK